MLLVGSVIALIAAAVLGLDRGVLQNMANPEYARGLITFLFAVVTIGSALLLIVSALISAEDEDSYKQFERGKAVLSILVGIFGTIVGYYFGSTRSGTYQLPLRASGIEILPRLAAPGAGISATALIAGGSPSYRYRVGFVDSGTNPTEHVTENGVISEQLTIPKAPLAKALGIRLTVQDALGRQAQATTTVDVAAQ